MTADLHVVTVPQQDVRLGRQVVHDPRSRNYPLRLTALPDLPTKAIRHRIYGPRITPNQKISCCSGVDQAVKCDAAGNRVAGVVLGMPDAERIYSLATSLDPFPGEYPPEDTGSSGLGACKASKQLGLILRYEWILGGARQVVAALAGGPSTPGRCVGIGTWWYDNMFRPDEETLLVKPTGPKVGGHQWTATGYEPRYNAVEGFCWWGPTFGDKGRFRIKLDDLDALLADDGDGHVTYRAT